MLERAVDIKPQATVLIINIEEVYVKRTMICNLCVTCSKSTTQWWDDEVMEALPLPVEETRKTVALLVPVTPSEPKVDLYFDCHRPFEFCVLSEVFTYHMSHSVRWGCSTYHYRWACYGQKPFYAFPVFQNAYSLCRHNLGNGERGRRVMGALQGVVEEVLGKNILKKQHCPHSYHLHQTVVECMIDHTVSDMCIK